MWKREYPLSNKANAFNAKLAPKYRGPLQVRRVVSPVIVDLRDKNGRWIRHIHLQDLKPAPADTPPNESDEDDRPENESDEDEVSNGNRDDHNNEAGETDAENSDDENTNDESSGPEDDGEE